MRLMGRSITTTSALLAGYIPRMNLVRIAAILGFLGVALGAFGAHGLRNRVGPEMLEIWKTGVLYHLAHALALLGVAALGPRVGWPRAVAGLFVGGVLIFSGTLYAMVITGNFWLGRITPIGGVALLGGWAALAASARGSTPPIDLLSSSTSAFTWASVVAEIARVVDEVSGQLLLFSQRQLGAQPGQRMVAAGSVPSHGAQQLLFLAGSDHHQGVEIVGPPGLHQQRGLVEHQPVPLGGQRRHVLAHPFVDARMGDGLQALAGNGLREHLGPQPPAVQRPVRGDDLRPFPGDLRQGRRARLHHLARQLVGVDQRHPQPLHHPPDGGLT